MTRLPIFLLSAVALVSFSGCDSTTPEAAPTVAAPEPAPAAPKGAAKVQPSNSPSIKMID